MPIHVLSQDGQSISGSRDTLTGGGGCSAHPCTLPGWSEYFRISGYSDRMGGAVSMSMSLSMCYPRMVRVRWVCKAGWRGLHIPLLSWDGQSISGVMARHGTTHILS